jgi:NDP-sugar pyrophosphorylase family protein
MRAVVLAGGRGTRLAPYTIAFPKPLLPVGEMPIIEVVLRQLRWHGFTNVQISVGYLAELIEAYFLTRGGVPGLTISYLREREPLGTAGAIGMLHDVTDDLLVMNGDLVTTLDYGKLMAFHQAERPAMTIAVNPRTVQIDLGVLEIDPQSTIVGYTEKPKLSYNCSMGIYVYSRQAAEAIVPGERLDLPELVQRLLARGERVLAYQSDCYWLDIGRHEDFQRAQSEFAEMRTQLLPDEQGRSADA